MSEEMKSAFESFGRRRAQHQRRGPSCAVFDNSAPLYPVILPDTGSRIATRSKANGTARFSPCCLAAGCEDGNWLIWTTRICSNERRTGRSSIWSVKAGTSGPYLCQPWVK